MADIITSNAKLALITPARSNWSDAANKNFEALDAIIGTYFIINQLQGPWTNSTTYAVNDAVIDSVTSSVWTALVAHTSSAIPTTFAQDRAAHSTYWATYAAPATARGVWTANTSYKLNDFVVSGAVYAICIATHTSGATFAADLALGKWSVLIDLSTVSSTIMPAPSGGDANKFTVINGTGSGYTLVSSSNALSLLGGTSIGIGVLQASSTAAALTAINAQVAGSYQPLDADLTSIAASGVTAYGLTLLLMANAAALKTNLSLGTAAYIDVGTSANQIVQLNGTSKLPAVDGSLLTNLASAWETGDIKIRYGTTAGTGWVLMADNSIGNAASAATARANADTQALFVYLYSVTADAQAPVSGGRTGNALNDYNANKSMTLPLTLGRALAVAGNGAGLTARAIGLSVGAENVTPALNAHTHTFNDTYTVTNTTVSVDNNGSGSMVNVISSLTTTTTPSTTASSGAGGTSSVMQPSSFVNVFIHL